MLHALLHGLSALLAPGHAWAFMISPPMTGGNPGGLEEAVGRAAPVLINLFEGVLIFMLIYNAGKMIIYSHEESQLSEAKKSYTYLIIACIVVGAADVIASTVTQNGVLFVGGPLLQPLTALSGFFKEILFAALIANIVIQGFRLVASHGESDKVSRARGRLIYGLIGAIVVLAAELIANAALGQTAAPVIPVIAQVANTLLTFIGIGVVTCLIIAGMYYILSIDESLKSKAQTLIKVSLVILVLLLLSTAIIHLFVDAANG